MVIQSMTSLLFQEFKTLRISEVKNWQNFSNLLRRELEQATFIRISDDFLYVQTPQGVRRFGQVTGSDDFRKTNEAGQGYQPMLFGLSAVAISQSGAVVKLHFSFSKGGERTFIYTFPNIK